jgi:hypothetical protein
MISLRLLGIPPFMGRFWLPPMNVFAGKIRLEWLRFLHLLLMRFIRD